MKKKIKILFATPEASPFIATGGLGEVAGSLPKALMKKYSDEMDVRIILPLYEGISSRDGFEYIGNTYVQLAWRQQYCGIYKKVENNLIYYFIDNEYYFKRSECYGHFDDGERFAFFSKAVLTILPIIDFIPHIIHANDWQTALIPVYLSTKYFTNKYYWDIKSIITVHNMEYQGNFDLSIVEDVFDLSNKEKDLIEYKGAANLLKAAFEVSHIISTVSKSYSEEILNDYFAHGLASIIQKNSSKLKGILNGIDTLVYNPETDDALFKQYNYDSLHNKTYNKTNLQCLTGLSENVDIPIIAVISWLVSHKGMDLIIEGMEEILKEKVQFIVLGRGDRKYELYFKSLQEAYRDKVAVRIDFNNDLARKIYGGSDFFLMPSISEPCGISQMIASRYGSVPIVHEVGGLKDSIKDSSFGSGNGFTFNEKSSKALVNTIRRGLKVYENKDDWSKLVKEVMRKDFSWENSSEKYRDMYLNLIN